MSKKRAPARRALSPQPVASPRKVTPDLPRPVGPDRRRQTLLLLTLVPMLAGIILFVAAWADWVFIGSQTGQTIVGALLALLGFAASNALQGRRMLAGGWAAVGVAIALIVGLGQQTWAVVAGGALGLAGVGLIGMEFARRLGQQSGRRR